MRTLCLRVSTVEGVLGVDLMALKKLSLGQNVFCGEERGKSVLRMKSGGGVGV